MMEGVDQFIRDIASNPYVIVLGLILTTGPVLWQLGRRLRRIVGEAILARRIGWKSYKFRKLIGNIRSGTRRGPSGSWVPKDVAGHEIELFLIKMAQNVSFYAFAVLFSALAANYFGSTPLIGAAMFTFLFSMAVVSALQSKIEQKLQVIKFTQRSVEKAIASVDDDIARHN